MTASFGEATDDVDAVRHLISLLTLSTGLVEWILVCCSVGKGHEREHIVLGVVHEHHQLLEPGPKAVGDLPPPTFYTTSRVANRETSTSPIPLCCYA